jgi:hypothetical protein
MKSILHVTLPKSFIRYRAKEMKQKELDLKVTKVIPIRAETGSCFDVTNFSKIKVSRVFLVNVYSAGR